MFRDFREFTLGEWIALACFFALAVAILIQLIDWSELWYKLRQWFLRRSCKSTCSSTAQSLHVGSSLLGCPCAVRTFKGASIPRGVDEDFQYSLFGMHCDLVLHASSRDCTGILCSQCILSGRNRHIAEQYFNCLKQKKEKEQVRTFRGLKIQSNVDENYNPCPVDNLDPQLSVCRRHVNEHVNCSGISCNECILSSAHAETADEYFKINHRDKVEMTIDTSKIRVDDRIRTFTSCYCETDDTYYVVIRFDTNRAEAEVMLKALPMPLTFFWVEIPPRDIGCKIVIMVPFCLKHQAEEFQTELRRALGRLSKKSEVDEFLNASRACSEGVAFAQDCKSMAEVWDKAVSTSRRDYLRFMLSAVRRGECARFNKSGQTDAELDWFNTNVFTVPDSIFQQTFSSINPFKEVGDPTHETR